jgi:hypothetical protein
MRIIERFLDLGGSFRIIELFVGSKTESSSKSSSNNIVILEGKREAYCMD